MGVPQVDGDERVALVVTSAVGERPGGAAGPGPRADAGAAVRLDPHHPLVDRVRAALPGVLDHDALPDVVLHADRVPLAGRSRKPDRAALSRATATLVPAAPLAVPDPRVPAAPTPVGRDTPAPAREGRRHRGVGVRRGAVARGLVADGHEVWTASRRDATVDGARHLAWDLTTGPLVDPPPVDAVVHAGAAVSDWCALDVARATNVAGTLAVRDTFPAPGSCTSRPAACTTRSARASAPASARHRSRGTSTPTARRRRRPSARWPVTSRVTRSGAPSSCCARTRSTVPGTRRSCHASRPPCGAGVSSCPAAGACSSP